MFVTGRLTYRLRINPQTGAEEPRRWRP